MSKSVKLSTGVALLLLAAGGYSWRWAQSRGAFYAKSVEIPIRLQGGSLVNIPFSVAERGWHDVEIQYPKDVSEDVGKELHTVRGTAIVRSEETVLTQAELPTHHIAYADDSVAMVLLTFEPEPSRHYVLSLQINYIPPNLSGAQAMAKIEVDRDTYKGLIALVLLSQLMALAGLVFIVPLIRFFILRLFGRRSSANGC